MIWTSRTLTLLGTASVISAPALCEDKDSDIDRSLSKIKKSARKDAKKTEDVHLSNEMDKLAREVGEKVGMTESLGELLLKVLLV